MVDGCPVGGTWEGVDRSSAPFVGVSDGVGGVSAPEAIPLLLFGVVFFCWHSVLVELLESV